MAFHRTTPPHKEKEDDWLYVPQDGYSPSPLFHESEEDNFSGLYDANGDRLYKEPRRVGFRLWEEPVAKKR